MTLEGTRQALLDFLDEKVFLPAIDADPARYTDPGDRKLLKRVKKRVLTTRLRYLEEYKTAEEVKNNFFQDLDSTFGHDLATEMLLLKMQRFEDVQKDFVGLCVSLGV